ncbi:uncharacterized protein [Chelonus insularis]|uniref:uncharacterized protein n=1 Tax=Chelonus insularis TaxID=460826 RepID=UPI00158ECA57|nr:uncharacterized protein LOC118065699 [Chelonus insularis]
MGLKWFRKQLRIKQSINSSELPGSYRKFSQFEFDEMNSSSLTNKSESDNGNIYRPKAIPVSPPSVPVLRSPQNPMASLLSRQVDNRTHSHDFGKELNNTSHDRQNNTLEVTHQTNNHLPRNSIDLLKINHSSEHSTDTMKKPGIRKKKGRAPLPQPAFTNGDNDDDFLKPGVVRSFRESDIEI